MEEHTEIFDIEIPRRGTGSIKWDLHAELQPYWIADMDTPSPECILKALHERVEHGIFGYSYPPADMFDVLARYMHDRHHADIRPEWCVPMTGCVPALSLVARTWCKPGDAVMTCSPVYPPIRSVHRDAGCDLFEVPHVWDDGAWQFDWEALEKAWQPAARLFVLCNPQNPLGRVWTEEEVTRLAEFCERHEMILCSDEIHCDLVLDEQTEHFTCMRLPDRLRRCCITLTAPSKTYNIAGLGFTFACIPDDTMRDTFRRTIGCTLPEINCFAYVAARAAYMEGEPWRQRLIRHLRRNRDLVYSYVAEHMPAITMHPMQATYLAWMDCSALGVEDPQGYFMEKAGVFLNSGAPFGCPQHVRFNFGTTRERLLKGLEAMARAIG